MVMDRSLTWSSHEADVYICSVPYISRRTQTQFVLPFVLSHRLYPYLVISSGHLSEDITLLSRPLKFLFSCNGLPRHQFIDFIICQQIKACQKLFSRGITDSPHPIHEHLTKCFFLSSVTPYKYKHRQSRILTYKCSTGH